MSPTRVLVVAAAVVSLFARESAAQIVQVQAGSSSLFEAHGGSIEVRNGALTFGMGAGRIGGSFTAGLVLRATVGRLVISGGDQVVDFDLPTDVFGGSRYAPVRGLGLERRTDRTRVLVVGGLTSETIGAPFFRGARGGDGAALLFLERQISPTLTFFSKSAAGRAMTSISGVAWRPAASVRLSAASGVGRAKPYAALSGAFRGRQLQITGMFVQQQAGFRRVVLDSPLAAEPTGGNVAVSYRHEARWSLQAAHRRMVGGATLESNGAVSLNQLGGDLNAAGFRLMGAVYESTGLRPRQLGYSASIGRRLDRANDLTIDYFRSRPSGGPPSESYVARLRTAVSPRIGVLNVATHSAGQTSYNLGGEFLSNPLRLAVTYNTVYAPLRLGEPFVRVIGIEGQLNVFDRITLNLSTYTTPDGQPRYTVSGNIIGGASGGIERRGSSIRMGRYVVRGRVENEAGEPVAGAVLHLGPEVLSTGSDGRFFWRTDKSGALTLEVAPDEFLAPGRYEIVSAPRTVTPVRTSAPEVTESVIVLRRV